MNEPEAFQLLTLASARDNRTVSQSVAKVWAEDLERVALADAIEGLKIHYREQPEKWLQPGHVIAGARRAREARLRAEARANRKAIEPNRITLDRAEFEAETQRAIEAERARKEAGNDE